MKKYLFLILFFPTLGFSQPGIINKVKQKIRDRVDQKVDRGIDKSIDKTEEEIERTASGSAAENNKKESDVVAEKPSPGLYPRYDFVPGENIVYGEDFAQDAIGEFPLKWYTNNRGEIISLPPAANKWLRLVPGGKVLSPAIKGLPENFTYEFDLLLQYKSEGEGYPYPNLQIGLLELISTDVNAKNYFNRQESLADMTIEISPSEEETSMVSFRSGSRGTTVMSNDWKTLKFLDGYFGKVIHVAVWVQKERFRLWLNNEKIYDIPNAIPGKAVFNRVCFETEASMYTDQQLGMFISNIKIAQGSPDIRSKLITEGKMTTHGIRFDVDSDLIKPESSGVLKEIAVILKDNPSLKVKIIGHTDSDGDARRNLDLSQRRAEAIKKALIKEFGIAGDRMATVGMGEDSPLVENTTHEGKLQNRRVEFIRQ